VQGAVEALVRMAEHGTLVDVMNILILKKDIFSLDICASLFPLLRDLLCSQYEEYVFFSPKTHLTTSTLSLALTLSFFFNEAQVSGRSAEHIQGHDQGRRAHDQVHSRSSAGSPCQRRQVLPASSPLDRVNYCIVYDILPILFSVACQLNLRRIDQCNVCCEALGALWAQLPTLKRKGGKLGTAARELSSMPELVQFLYAAAPHSLALFFYVFFFFFLF
jgi:hypothetical protein